MSKVRKSKARKKRKAWSKLVFVCPTCMSPHIIEQPIPAIRHGFSMVRKLRNAVSKLPRARAAKESGGEGA